MDSYIIDTPDFQLTQLDFLIRLLVVTGIGLLLGLEREYAAMNKKENVLPVSDRLFFWHCSVFSGQACLSYFLHGSLPVFCSQSLRLQVYRIGAVPMPEI
jgi:hypothetical protein